MRRIKLGKGGLLRSLFPSSKKKSSSRKNKSSSSTAGGPPSSKNTPVNNGSSSSSPFNCPTVLGGGRRKIDHRPYELHQEGASSPPSSDDEGRDHENAFGTGVGETERQIPQLQFTPQQQQQQEIDTKGEANVITPITVACSSSIEEQDREGKDEARNSNMVVTDKFAAATTDELECDEEEEKQDKDDIIEHCIPQSLKQQGKDESFDTAFFDHQSTSASSSPSRDEARRRAIARQQRILSQASTRFQALSETATIDTTEFAYCSPPHLQRRRWQQHIGRQTRPQAVGDGNQKVTPSPQGQSIIGLPPRQPGQLPQTNKNYSSVVFYDSTPTRDLATPSNSNNNSSISIGDSSKHQEGKFSSPTCVADFEASTPGHGSKGAGSSKQVASSSNSNCPSTSTYNNIHFFILLLCPNSRIFEVIELSDAPLDSNVGDVLKLIPQHVTDGRLLKKKYIGLCRPADRTEFIDLALPAFLSKKDSQGEDCTPFDFIHENDVLVAILKGSTCYQMSKISKPILKNPKFKEMIRRRRRQSAADKAARKKKRKSKKRHDDKLKSPTKEIYVPDDCSVVSGITCAKPVRSRSRGGEDPTSLSKMLETLSKKLHEVEEEGGAYLPDCDTSSMGGSSKQRSVSTDLDEAKRKGQNNGFKMSPKMIAMELAQTIEDIFANNNVELVAVDVDDNDEDDSRIDVDDDDDSDTFVSARSHRTRSTVATLKSTKMPRSIVTSNYRTKTSPRQFKFTETMEDNALAAQIEAMAAQADAAFEDRGKKNSSRGVAETIDKMRSTNSSPASDDAAVTSTQAVSVNVDCDTQDLSESFETTFDALSHIECDGVEAVAKVTNREREGVDVVGKVTNRASKDTVARNFLNASTSTVSKMVADNQGRVNEVHVLESLGCTIVCIAANYMQTNRQKGKAPSIETKDVFQSATFLAFMVSGQRYLAKVTNK